MARAKAIIKSGNFEGQFIVLEGTRIVGSFVSFRAAEDFINRRGFRTALIFADDGRWDLSRFGGTPRGRSLD